MDYREAKAPPDRWQDFEDLCLKLWRPRLIDAKKHGRSGQPQAGVDIFGRDPKSEGWVGIQCKQKGQWPPQVLTIRQIEDEIREAESFEPPLSHFIVATTAQRDAKLQAHVRRLSEERRETGQFTVDLFAWDDLQEWLHESPEPISRDMVLSQRSPPSTDFQYDIAISYAGEDRDLAGTIASKLEARGVSVFFAPSQQARLLGERLEDVFAKTFGSFSRFVAVLVSDEYPIKDWTRYELGIARDEEQQRNEAFVLPLRIADARMVEIPPDKGYLDLRTMDLDAAIEILVEKVRLHRGEPSPKEIFEAAFREWKTDGYIPGMTKSDVFWRNSKKLELDVDRCEFLLRSPSRRYEWSRATLKRIDPVILRAAGERLLATAETPSFELAAIGYIGLADPERAEFHFWRIYEDEKAHINDRARAFEGFWRCPSARSHEEPKEVLVDETAPWPLRRAAAVNILWGERDDNTEILLAKGLEDPRREVRSKVIDAIVKFRLDALSPQLIKAYGRDRSRKGRADLKAALRLFNTRQDVIDFGRKSKFGKAFFKPPPYVHDWEESREDWV